VRPVTIARNYAETLYELGERSDRAELYGELLDAVAGALESTPAIADMLMSPRVPKSEKSRIIGAGLKDAPREFVLFLQAVVKRGRGPLLREIATGYSALLDVKFSRLRAGVTLAKAPERQKEFHTGSQPVERVYTPADIADNDYLRDVGFEPVAWATGGAVESLWRKGGDWGRNGL